MVKLAFGTHKRIGRTKASTQWISRLLDQRDQINILGLANIGLVHEWSFIQIGTKFSDMLSNHKWTYVEVVPIWRLINSNLCILYLDKWYRDYYPVTCNTIRKGKKMKREGIIVSNVINTIHLFWWIWFFNLSTPKIQWGWVTCHKIKTKSGPIKNNKIISNKTILKWLIKWK